MVRLRSNLQGTRPFNLDDGKLKTDAHNIILLFFYISNFSRLAPVDFGSVLFQLVIHSGTLTLQLRLRSKLQLSRWFDWKGVQTTMAKLTANGYLLGRKNVEKTGFSSFSGNLQQNAWQFSRIAQIRFKLTKKLPTRVYKVYQKRKRQLSA